MNNPRYTPEEPISSIATALAPAALGIVRTSGKNCIELVSKVFSAPGKLLEAGGNSIVYGWIKKPDSDKTEKQLIDEVMVAVYRAPKSFTGEDMAEIFCHGGPSVVTAIQSLLLKNGFRQAERGEYTFRAYINGKTDLTKAEAVREIIDSHTDTARGRAAGRLAGALYEEIDSIKKLIVDTLAAIEVEIEYPEDEETIADSFDSKKIEEARDRLQTLVDSWKGEKLYQDGARVVLCGRTNAGKSSLFNAILKEERAIVSDIAGTTRDWLESWASFDGIPVRLFDTAGLRKTSDAIEAQGVELTKSLSADADVVLYLVDSTIGAVAPKTPLDEESPCSAAKNAADFADTISHTILSEDDIAFLKTCDVPTVLVWNKCDAAKDLLFTGEVRDGNQMQNPLSFREANTPKNRLSMTEANSPQNRLPMTEANSSQNRLSMTEANRLKNSLSLHGEMSSEESGEPHSAEEFPMIRAEVFISAKKGIGLDSLYKSVKSILTSGLSLSTERLQAGLGSERQKEAVAEALESVEHALVSASDNYTLDAVVQDLEDALESLGVVTGDVTPDDVLGSIFANFCVGK